MLNELYTLFQCLQRCGIQVGLLHQDVKTPGKGEGFIVSINKKGMPETVEYVSAENMAKLWKLCKGKHNSFPYIKLKKPIFETIVTDQIHEDCKSKKKYNNKKSLLTQVKENFKFNKQNLGLAQWTKDKISVIKEKDKGLKALVELTDRMPTIKNDSAKFFKKLAELLLGSVSEEKIDLVKTILIGDIEKKKKEIVCNVPLFFDVSDWDRYACRVASSEMGMLVSKYLPKAISRDKKNSISAFGSNGLHTGPYPDPKLPAIGITYLFSMNKDAVCHYRYGKIASTIFPTSPSEVEAMHGALKWSVSNGRKGKTWHSVPNIKRKQDLVIAYLEEMPEAPAELASCISEFDSDESEMKEADYEERASAVCKALEGGRGLNKDSKVNILVLTKVDEGRGQVVLSGTYTISNIIESVRQWQTASKNRPDFSVLLPGRKGESAKPVEPFCPSPAQVMRCLQNQWGRNGLDKCKVPGVALRQVYDLFLGGERLSQESARIILSLVLQRLRQLLIGFAAADHARNTKDYSVEARRTVLIGISILAIVLYKLGIKKEDCMGNAAFNVGKLLAFADSLHAQYCKLQMKRKGDLPPQLIGNAVLPVAFENPNKALALLGDRLRIYYAWATKVQGEEYRLVKWMMSEMGKISAELENVTWPSMTDDAVKAQVLLGYLARSKSEE